MHRFMLGLEKGTFEDSNIYGSGLQSREVHTGSAATAAATAAAAAAAAATVALAAAAAVALPAAATVAATAAATAAQAAPAEHSNIKSAEAAAAVQLAVVLAEAKWWSVLPELSNKHKHLNLYPIGWHELSLFWGAVGQFHGLHAMDNLAQDADHLFLCASHFWMIFWGGK